MPEENPYQPPRHPEAVPDGMSWRKVLFSFKGRIPRSTYWIFSLPVNLAIAFLFDRFWELAELYRVSLSPSALPPPEVHADGLPVAAQVTLMFLLYLPLLWMKLAILAKRWQDQNRSANWLMVTFIPVVGMVINFLECGLNPGTRGENRYGKDPVPDPKRRPLRPPSPTSGRPEFQARRPMSAPPP